MNAFSLTASTLAAPDAPPGAPDVSRVVSGTVDVFAVRLDAAGTPVGRRRHVCRRVAGDLVFAVPPHPAVGFLVVPAPDTELTAFDPVLIGTEAFAASVDAWIEALTESLFTSTPPKEWTEPVPGETCEIQEGAVLRSRDALVWVAVEEGGAVVNGQRAFAVGREAIPVNGTLWLGTTAAARFTTTTTQTRITDGTLDADLDRVHTLVLELFAREEARSQRSEEARAARRTEGARAALRQGTGHLASILVDDTAPREVFSDDPFLAAASRVGRTIGVTVKAPPARLDTGRRDRVGEIARASRLRVRRVVLSGNWWKEDIGPVLAMRMPKAEGSPPTPVALVPQKGRMVMYEGPVSTPLTEELAEEMHPVGFTFYRPFPDKALSALDVVRFGLFGGGRDLLTVLAVGLVVGLLGLITPYVTGELFQTAVPEADRSLLVQLIAALFAAALGTTAFHATRGFALLRLESRMDATVQAAVWDRLLKLPTAFFRQFTAGDLASRASTISTIRQLLSGATITSVMSAVFSLMYVGLMLWYSVTLTLWAMGITAVALAVTLGTAYVQLRHQREVARVQSRLHGRVLQFLTGLTKLRVAGAEAKAFAQWAEDFGAQRSLQVRARRVANRLFTFNAAFPVLASIVLFTVEVSGADGPLLPVGIFVAFQAAFGSFTSAVLSLSTAFTSVLVAIPLYEQAEPILTALPEVDEDKGDPGELTGRLAVEHVTFRYQPDTPPILHDVSIRAEPGEFIALVGPSGSGKSTLLRLLLGFELPESGTVTYDDQDLSALDVQAVRRQLGVVLQSGGLMQGDLFTNIVGSTGATHEDAWEAARMAGFDKDVKAMPMGMHTVVSEGGSTLSGGQRQRLMIARAIVNRPRILYFDEATSALDNHTQATVSRSLEGMEATRIVVAHRLSTIQKADRIYVLERGRVVQEGSYEQLIAVPGLFAQLAARQLA